MLRISDHDTHRLRTALSPDTCATSWNGTTSTRSWRSTIAGGRRHCPLPQGPIDGELRERLISCSSIGRSAIRI